MFIISQGSDVFTCDTLSVGLSAGLTDFLQMLQEDGSLPRINFWCQSGIKKNSLQTFCLFHRNEKKQNNNKAPLVFLHIGIIGVAVVCMLKCP